MAQKAKGMVANKSSRQEFLDKVEKTAQECEREVHGCGRCVLKSLMEHFGLGDESSKDLMLKAIMPLSGGIAQTRNTCAAVLGGMMAIGMVFFQGRIQDATTEDLFAAMAMGRKFYRSFEKEMGHVRCFDIRETELGRCYDGVDPVEYEKFEKAGGYELCGRVAGKAARIAAKFILEMQEHRNART